MRRLALPFLLLPLAACPPDKTDTDSATHATEPTTGDATTHATDHTTGGTSAPVADCDFLVGKTFGSDVEMECGLGPNGPEPCTWTITFAESTYEHNYSDIQDSGTYTCADGVIAAMGGFDMAHAGTVDAETGKLTWDDVAYTVVP